MHTFRCLLSFGFRFVFAKSPRVIVFNVQVVFRVGNRFQLQFNYREFNYDARRAAHLFGGAKSVPQQ